MRARWVGLVAVAVALAGCGGIPTSGSVEPGSIIDEEDLLPVAFDPGGPQVGAGQSEIMLGFIAAATNPQDDYAVARLFLADPIRDEWDPDAITQIRTGIAQPRQESDTSYSYTMTSSAHVNDSGQYFDDEPATQVLDFSFVLDEDEQWRIASAPPGIVLTRESFNLIFEQHPLYFLDPSNSYLIADLRWFPKTTRLATTVVQELLKGPSAWLQQGVTTSHFPAGTTLDSSVSIESGVATLALSEEVSTATGDQLQFLRQQLRETIGNVSSVVITVNGVPLEEQEGGPASATKGLAVEDQPLVQQGDVFGFLTSNGSVSPLSGLTTEVVGLGALDATLARSKSAAAVLTPSGAWYVFTGSADAVQLDSRPGLLAPALDNSGFVWTVPASDASAITAYDTDGDAFAISAPQFAGMQAVSLTISRDGARLLLLANSPLGPKLLVAGIVRTEGVPTQIGAPLQLPISATATALDATWVDDNTIATLTIAADDEQSTISSYQIGGPVTTLGRVADGISIVGGNAATDGLRVMTSAGDLFQRRGNGWADTGKTVTFLATQQ